MRPRRVSTVAVVPAAQETSRFRAGLDVELEAVSRVMSHLKSAAAIERLGANTAAVHAAKDDPVALEKLKLTMTPKEFADAVQSAAVRRTTPWRWPRSSPR